MPSIGKYFKKTKTQDLLCTKIFNTVSQKNSTRNPDTPSFAKNARNFTKTHTSYVTKYFGIVRRKHSREHSNASVPHIFLIAETFRNTERRHYSCFLRQKVFIIFFRHPSQVSPQLLHSTKNNKKAAPGSFCFTRNFQKDQRVPSLFFWYCDTVSKIFPTFLFNIFPWFAEDLEMNRLAASTLTSPKIVFVPSEVFPKAN